jgi:hypothetical protein
MLDILHGRDTVTGSPWDPVRGDVRAVRILPAVYKGQSHHRPFVFLRIHTAQRRRETGVPS